MPPTLLLAAIAFATEDTAVPSAADPHAWLEAVHDPAALDTVRRWNQATQDRLGADPRYTTFKAEALDILTSEARIADGGFRAGGVVGFWRDTEHVRGLWRRASVRSYLAGTPEWEVLLDLDALDAVEGQNWHWEGATCAPKSDRCLVHLSRGASDAAEWREFDVRQKAFVEGGFHVPEAKSQVAWVDEDTLLVSTDRGPDTLTRSGYGRTLAWWRRGTALSDAPVVHEGEVTDVSVTPWVARHGKQVAVFATRARTFWETELVQLVGPDRKVPMPFPAKSRLVGLFQRSLLVRLDEDWQHGGELHPMGSLVSWDLDTGTSRTVFAPTRSQVIEEVAIGERSVFVALLDDVAGKLVRLKPDGATWSVTPVALPQNGKVQLSATSDDRDDAVVTFESLTVPNTLFHVDAKDRVRALQALPEAWDPEGVVVEQRFATSADGTRVPYWLMARADVLAAGPAPTLQYGYGGFQNATLPTYFEDEARPQHGALAGRIWVSRGGVLVLTNLRGGSEFGPAWHQAALLHERQRSFDDFFAISEALIADGVTTPDQLGAVGRSNGGLLMGVAFTQRPDLYGAIVCGVPLLDMLRYDRLLAGASWVAEYGDPDVPADRAVLERYSPYQQVRPGVTYPKVLLYTSTLDDRVHPGHARKMAAKLEELGVPFEYYENVEGGHGGFANQDQAAHRIALEYTHLAVELGLD